MKPTYWPAATRHLAKQDKVMKALIARYQGEMLSTRGDAFYTLARSIAGQQISVKAADSVWRKLEAAAGKMQPKRILEMTPEELRACGLSQGKITYLLHIAEHFHRNKKRVAEWDALEDELLIKEMTALHGVGRWTAEMMLIFHYLRPDVFPVADLGVLKAIYRHYNNGEKMDKADVLELAARWSPYRTVATWYLWRALDPMPVEY